MLFGYCRAGAHGEPEGDILVLHGHSARGRSVPQLPAAHGRLPHRDALRDGGEGKLHAFRLYVIARALVPRTLFSGFGLFSTFVQSYFTSDITKTYGKNPTEWSVRN